MIPTIALGISRPAPSQAALFHGSGATINRRAPHPFPLPTSGGGKLAESLASRHHDDIASSEPRGAEKTLVRGLPDPPFHRVEQACEHDEEDHDSEADSLSL